MTRGWRTIFVAVLAGLLVGSCTGGSETAGIDRGGVRRTPVAVEGPITGFGSIVVNGVHYDVSRATIRVDRMNASVADLALGQLVTVIGERDTAGTTGNADSVTFQANVRGPVESVDMPASRFVVLGQLVTVGADTVLDLGSHPRALASLVAGDIVEVSGFVAADGSIDATRVALRSRQSELMVFGIVSNVDTALLRFDINGLVVDYSAAGVIEGFPSGQPANGDEVVVEGSMSSALGRFLATELEREDDELEGGTGREAEVEGRVTRFASLLDFDVAGKKVTTTASTQYTGGSASSIVLDAKVHVAGTFDASGVIRAQKIEIENEDD